MSPIDNDPGEAFSPTIYTIGHGVRDFDEFVELLLAHSISVLVDLRTSPWSKFAPQFNQSLVRDSLGASGVRYVFMGDNLGGRPDGSEFYDPDGRVRYDKLALSESFLEGIKTLEDKRLTHTIAVFCSEADYLECHRYLLVGEVLSERGAHVLHIDKAGAIREHTSIFADEVNTLFEMEEKPEWKSKRSVRRGQPEEH
jgi:uncharacterized protein (DUF488 family)